MLERRADSSSGPRLPVKRGEAERRKLGFASPPSCGWTCATSCWAVAVPHMWQSHQGLKMPFSRRLCFSNFVCNIMRHLCLIPRFGCPGLTSSAQRLLSPGPSPPLAVSRERRFFSPTLHLNHAARPLGSVGPRSSHAPSTVCACQLSQLTLTVGELLF